MELVKREEYGNVIVDVGRGEAMSVDEIKRLLIAKCFRNGDRVRALHKRCKIRDTWSTNISYQEQL